jgi:hypothetical protein
MWLGSDLPGRIQKIRIGDVVSKDIMVTLGVPQGCHLGPLCFIWFVNRISEMFDYVRMLFYADVMKLFLPVSGFQDCLRVQSDLNKLSEWCDRNSLLLNVGKGNTIKFVDHVTVLDRVNSINNLGVIMDDKMTFSDHVDVMVAMLGFIRTLTLEFKDPYTLKSIYTSLVRPKLAYASCVWNPFYDVRSTEWNACRGGLFDMLCVVWVGRACMICHHMKRDSPFCNLTPLRKGDRLLV